MSTYFEFAARGRNAWWRYLLSPLVGLLLAGLILLVLGVGLTLMRLMPPNIATQILQPKYATVFFLGTAVTFAAFAAGLAIAAFFLHRKRPLDIIGQWRWDFFAWGLGIWLVVQTALTLIDVLIAPRGFAISASHGSATFALIALIGIMVQAFTEEFIFRGYVTQGLLLAFKKPLPAAIVSGLLFGSVHIANGVPQTLNAIVFGIVCALIAIRTGGIAITYGIHVVNNYFGAVVVISGNDVFKGSPGIITQATPQLVWWDLCVGIAALIGVTWLIFRRPYFSTAPAACG
jgi:membrane protease YdiL (CAAX protease family)